MTATAARHASIDDILGPAGGRFFGAGFRRVAYRVTDVDVDTAADGTVAASATLGVDYPLDWSRKDPARELRPHLSTVDALLLGVDLCALCLDAGDATTVRISAGRAPQEELDSLPVTVTGRPATAPPGGAGDTVLGDVRIGSMRVRCAARVPATRAPGRRRYADASDRLGPAADRYHGGGFAAWRQEIHDVLLDPAGGRASATLTVAPDPQAGAPRCARPASITTVDAFVTALQLGQALLYRLDSVPRERSDTLWMRSTTVHAGTPAAGADAGCAAVTTLENSEVVEMAGRRWRTADIVADIGGVAVRCAVTHRLPR